MTTTQSKAASEDEDGPPVEFRSDVTVELVRVERVATADVLFAARVSTKGEQSLDDVEADAQRSAGLIRFLMRDRHGIAVRAQLDDVLRAGADLRVPRAHAAPDRVLQRGERAATASSAGVLRARAGAQARPGGQARRYDVRRRHARAARDRRRRRRDGLVRRPMRRTSGCSTPVWPARSPASCCRCPSTRRRT